MYSPFPKSAVKNINSKKDRGTGSIPEKRGMGVGLCRQLVPQWMEMCYNNHRTSYVIVKNLLSLGKRQAELFCLAFSFAFRIMWNAVHAAPDDGPEKRFF